MIFSFINVQTRVSTLFSPVCTFQYSRCRLCLYIRYIYLNLVQLENALDQRSLPRIRIDAIVDADHQVVHLQAQPADLRQIGVVQPAIVGARNVQHGSPAPTNQDEPKRTRSRHTQTHSSSSSASLGGVRLVCCRPTQQNSRKYCVLCNARRLYQPTRARARTHTGNCGACECVCAGRCCCCRRRRRRRVSGCSRSGGN